ncbi:MAG: hypothetical protein QM779_03550 [Propionicimonas sp.]|uniref:hypothetical protein n=1 Tax=Propionicimonas sp. TaxID=1955623 RepID=UPI003D0B63AA
MSTTSPTAPGQLGVAAQPAQVLDYLGRLDAWLRERRSELDALDEQIVTTGRQQELTPDLTLALALWQAAKTRQNLLLAAWDSGRVGREELERVSALIWGRLDTAGSQVAQLQSMSVSLPEAGRLCDALVGQLRTRLDTDPGAEQQQVRLRDLRAQLERIRDQLKLEPPALAPAGTARLAGLAARTDELVDKRARGGDIGGLLSSLEVEAARFERDLIVGSAQRREGRDLLVRAREQLAQASAREQAVRALAAQVAAAVWPAPQVVVPSVAGLGPLPNTRTALVGYVDGLSRLDAQLGEAQAALTRATGDRDGAAALLGALQAKAAALGATGDPGLAGIAALATDSLAATPAVIPVIQQLVGAYQARLDYLGKR